MRPRRRLLAALMAVSAALATVVAPSSSATAADIEQAIEATVDLVQVNKMGGITVSGSLDCTAQVAAIYGGTENIPAETTALVNVNWDALQFVGKTKAISASYDSGIASICFTNDPAWGAQGPPYPWQTRYGYPVGTTQWVYSLGGKFAAGPIHIELEVAGEHCTAWQPAPGEEGDSECTESWYLYDFSGWNLRAMKVR